MSRWSDPHAKVMQYTYLSYSKSYINGCHRHAVYGLIFTVIKYCLYMCKLKSHAYSIIMLNEKNLTDIGKKKPAAIGY